MSRLPILTGRPVSLAVLDYGLFRVHANGRVIGIMGALIETDAGERVIVDGGFPAKYAVDAQAATQEDRLYEFGEVLSVTPENRPAPQLEKLGLTPSDIDLFVLSHSHIDHVGALDDFPRAPMIVAAAERALPRPLYWSCVQPLDWPDRDTIEIEADTAIGPGLTALVAPGHAPGQIALMIELPETGPLLWTSDAISRPAEIGEAFDTAPDPATALASAHRLMGMARACDAMVIYGHCPDQWPTLRKAPDRYR